MFYIGIHISTMDFVSKDSLLSTSESMWMFTRGKNSWVDHKRENYSDQEHPRQKKKKKRKKEKKRTMPSNYKPITCLPMMQEMLNTQIK